MITKMVGAVLADGQVEWFEIDPPAENTLLFVRVYTEEDIERGKQNAKELFGAFNPGNEQEN